MSFEKQLIIKAFSPFYFAYEDLLEDWRKARVSAHTHSPKLVDPKVVDSYALYVLL